MLNQQKHQETLPRSEYVMFVSHEADSKKISISNNYSNTYSLLFGILEYTLALCLLCIFLIAAPFIWFANLIFDRGPLFYKQERVGKDGTSFYILKFRSMVIHAESDGKARFATKNDHRITKVGSILRKTRLDEVPQIINVFKGQMSLIGPRPERPEFVEVLASRDSDYYLRCLVKPGITGWAQVKYKYTSTLDDGLIKMRYDLHYISHRNYKMDIEVLLRTIYLVIGRKGT